MPTILDNATNAFLTLLVAIAAAAIIIIFANWWVRGRRESAHRRLSSSRRKGQTHIDLLTPRETHAPGTRKRRSQQNLTIDILSKGDAKQDVTKEENQP